MYIIRATNVHDADFQNVTIYDPCVDELQVIAAVLTKEDNQADNFTFTPAHDNRLAQNLEILNTYIVVVDDGKQVFRGRILNVETDLYNNPTYVCEGELAFLADSIVRPYNTNDWSDRSVGSYINYLLREHNDRVDPNRRIFLRSTTVDWGTGNGIRASSVYPDTLNELISKLPDVLGGHLMIDQANGVTVLDYYAESPFESNQTIELGENILDLSYMIDGSDIATTIIPLGAKIDEDTENERRLTITSVNNALDFVSDADAVEKYGHISKVVIYDDVTLPHNLLERGLRALKQNLNLIATVTVNVIDLQKTGVDVDVIGFLDYVRVKSELHGLDGKFLVTRIEKDLLNPANDTLTLGNSYKSLTKSTAVMGEQVRAVYHF